ncbi:TetR/AcrR family transcriptional regulator [Saccharothrix variisporea]|uniref:TetR family transcriptional regulator n=1 Tax=Saccharothrix variisporea TaxID=543527 RepID=A0A495X381_9PSEU|nr:TetR/AcrR family transcriptional regulator [Saccharothrix variisporea]RKT67976.1 TetR family transcriptional regulator [Saccharothrix variisporea]
MARAGITADRLTRAAADLADEIGFEAVTVSALARHFGVKDASLYSHVRNVQDLKVRVAGLALSELADQASAALAGRAGKDALVAFANAYRDYAHRHPGRYASMRTEIDPNSPAATAARRHSDLTRAVLRGYDLQEPDQTDAVRMLHSTLHGYVNLELAGGFSHHPRDSATSWTRALDTLHAVLSGWPEPAA